MKELFIADLTSRESGSEVALLGWISGKRRHGNVVFLDVADSTGWVQVVASKADTGVEAFDLLRRSIWKRPWKSSVTCPKTGANRKFWRSRSVL